jgi:hypothetical protein
MAAQWRVVRTAPGPDSQAALGNQRGEDSPFDPGARGVLGHQCSGRGEQVRCRGPRGSLERGGSLSRGVQPWSEVEVCSRTTGDGCLMGRGGHRAAVDRGLYSCLGRGWFGGDVFVVCVNFWKE